MVVYPGNHRAFCVLANYRIDDSVITPQRLYRAEFNVGT